MTNRPDPNTAASTRFFPDFTPLEAEAEGVRFAGAIGGEGPPLLLLHGYPQTHITWRKVTPTLARSYRVIIPDLPGYGASTVDAGGDRWTKRRVGRALHALMRQLGHERYAVVGHDRGARVGYRMALDRPEAVTAFASLAVVPTLDALEAIDWREAKAKFHWFFLAQPEGLPERLLADDPDLFLDRALDGMTGGRAFLEDAARETYREAFRSPSVRHAMCEDYRAALDEDYALDVSDRAAGCRLRCPVLSLWPASDHDDDKASPIDIWRLWADDVTGAATGGGHLMSEEMANEVLGHLLPFLAALR